MSHKFSQEAISFVSTEKAKWAELQLINAVDQLLIAQKEIEKLKTHLDEANATIDKIKNETRDSNGN
jgi:hypothetical protein